MISSFSFDLQNDMIINDVSLFQTSFYQGFYRGRSPSNSDETAWIFTQSWKKIKIEMFEGCKPAAQTCLKVTDDIHVRLQSVKGTLLFYIGLFIVTFQVL